MKIFKVKYVCFVLAVYLTMVFASRTLADEPTNEQMFIEQYGEQKVYVYDSDELTYDILANRNGNIIIERTLGVCKDEEKNGEILNPLDVNYNYISYKGVENAHEGNIIVTYLIYNPQNNYEDDIVLRYDYVLY